MTDLFKSSASTKSGKSARTSRAVSFRDSAEVFEVPRRVDPGEFQGQLIRTPTSPPPASQEPTERCCDQWPYCDHVHSTVIYSQQDKFANLDRDNDSGSSIDTYERSVQDANAWPLPAAAPFGSLPTPQHYSFISERTLIGDSRWATDDESDTLSIATAAFRRSMSTPYWTSRSSLDNQLQFDKDIEKRRSQPVKDPFLVSFKGPNDPNNPRNWPAKTKWRIVFCVASFTFLSPFTSSMIAPGLPEIARDFHIRNDIEIQMVLSLFVLAFAIGPVIFGPLSELYGRVSVLQGANVLFLTFTIACGFAQSEAQIMAFRFLAGLGGSAPLAVGAGVLGDLFVPEERGKAMALYGLGPLLGPSLGPLVGAFIAQDSTWRWMFWSASCASAIVLTLSFIFLKECHSPVILHREAAYLRKTSGVTEYRTQSDDPSKTVARSILNSLFRASGMLFTQPIVQVLALFMAYAFGTMYLILSTFPELWTNTYHESQGIAGLNYLSLGLGFFLGAPITGKSTDLIYRKLTARDNAKANAPRLTGDPTQNFSALRSQALSPSDDEKSILSRKSREGQSQGNLSPLLVQSPVMSAAPATPATPASPATPLPSALPAVAVASPRASTTTAAPQGSPAAPPSGPPLRTGKPEYRLPLLIPFSLLPPAGLFIYGWTSRYQLHWILPNIGTFLFAMGTVATFSCVSTYLIDSYGPKAASAVAAVTVLRSLAGFGFPLFAPRMYQVLGLGWGNSVLGFASLVIGGTAPVGLWIFGERLRKRSGMAMAG